MPFPAAKYDVPLDAGAAIGLRLIEPQDKEALRRAFHRFSPGSRDRRLLSPTDTLSERMLRYLTEVDHSHHEAVVAFDPVADDLVGVARYVRWQDRADAAEAAVAIATDWRGRGLGTALLEVLAGRARQEGIARFTAVLLAENDEVMELMRHIGPVRVVDRFSGTVEIEVELAPHGLASRLRRLLRAARRLAPGSTGAGAGPDAPLGHPHAG